MAPGSTVLPHGRLHPASPTLPDDLHRNGSDPRRSRSLRTNLTDGLRKNLTERRAGQVKRETRYDYAAAVGMRYQRSGREQKGWILDEFCAATGYNRKYAIKLLRCHLATDVRRCTGPRRWRCCGRAGRSPTTCVVSDWRRF